MSRPAARFVLKQIQKREPSPRKGSKWESNNTLENSGQTDFTKVTPTGGGEKRLLVFVDAFSGWKEAFPTQTETAQIVGKKHLQELVPDLASP